MLSALPGVKCRVQDVLNTYTPLSARYPSSGRTDYPQPCEKNLQGDSNVTQQTLYPPNCQERSLRKNGNSDGIQQQLNLTQALGDLESPPSQMMDWENFQDLDQWVNMPQLVDELGADELSLNATVITGQSELDHLSNTSTPIPDEEAEVSPWTHFPPMFSATTMSPIFESPIVDTNIISAQSLFTTVATSDDIGHSYNTQCNINDNLLVNGIINSKNMQEFNDDSNIIAYDSLDVIDRDNDNSDLWHKLGLKSTDNNVMLPEQILSASDNKCWKNEHSTEVIYTNLNTKLDSAIIDISMQQNEEATPPKPLPHRPKALEFDRTQTFHTEVLDTPDVINTVLSLKKDADIGFDLLAFINEDYEATTVELDPVKTHKRKRSGNQSVDDDEPTRKKSSVAPLSPPESIASTSSSATRRGRPPKVRTSSISSEDTDGSKYRELRDKNNEASRRSRINRKLREAHFEQEATDLEKENVRLTARVKELDQLVSRMREALLTTVLKK